jgi:alpha-ribazole phosphatase
MQEIYLIRHTTPAVAKGICYGQSDLDTTESLEEEAGIIRRHLPDTIGSVHSSPLLRCRRLTSWLFPSHPVILHDDLMEIHCGEWEMKKWDELPEDETGPWMKDFVNVRIPGGESYVDLHQRVNRCFQEIREGVAAAPMEIPAAGSAEGTGSAEGEKGDKADGPIVIVAHGGVIRSILSAISGTALPDSFKVFALYYGCVVKITDAGGILQYEVLSNRVPEIKEQHKPSHL